MGAGQHGGFGNTKGRKSLLKLNLQFFASKVFEAGGYLSEKSFEGHREFFLGKSPERIAKEMEKYGYKVKIEDSRHKFSKAKRIVVLNPSKERNISVVQVSPGSHRHGDTAYIKVSTTNGGKYKIVSKKDSYTSDGQEKAKIYFPRRKKND
ncbi:MAG: hypothetical protein K6F30_00155 [Lachnospiraceae bacterium]|nr:hypothetical protein [Lachnospiraceae bacterium]